MRGLKPKVFLQHQISGGLLGPEVIPHKLTKHLLSVFPWGGVVDSATPHEDLALAGTFRGRKWTENYKEKEKWQPIH